MRASTQGEHTVTDDRPGGIRREGLIHALREPGGGGDYARGVQDVLWLLGLTAADGAPTGEVAGMVIDSLRAHLRDGVTVGLAWNDLDGGGLRGADVLRAVEDARRRSVADPTPARVVRVVQAIVKARRGADDFYLMQYDRHAGRYQPIGGKQDPEDASPEAALRREFAEELELDGPPGPHLLAMEPLHAGWRTLDLSATYGVLTAYEMDFFAATAVRFPIPVDADTRWLTLGEIGAEKAKDGRAISPVYQQALGGLDRLRDLRPALELD
jgi:8-oxo-dGTP pyrophosphatase MutT (NUDIX family)